jgi:hypothetical protein
LYGSSISAYHHESYDFESGSWRGVVNTVLCDKVCQWLATGQWFSPGTAVSSINKTNHNDITGNYEMQNKNAWKITIV